MSVAAAVANPSSVWTDLAALDTEPWPEPLVGAAGQPQSWDDGDPKIWKLYQASLKAGYNLFEDIDWALLDPADFTPEQRIGIAYWFALDAVFEQTGTTVFARAMIESYELSLEESTRRMLMSITRDEGNHDLTGKLVCARLAPGFPYAFTPKTPLEWAAMRNLAWAQQSVARFWRGYCEAFKRHRFQVLLSGFASGEAVGTQTYFRMSEGSSHPVFKQLMKFMATDEGRHLQFALSLATRFLPTMTEQESVTTLKNLGASYAYFSLFLADHPNPLFWKHLPASWLDGHHRLEEHARSGGLAIAPGDMRTEFWRRGLLRVKAITDPLGLEFIAIPELGIDGREQPITVDDAIAVAF